MKNVIFFQKLWGSQVDPRLCQYINNFLFGQGENRLASVEFDRFAELFVYCTRGTLDEKITILSTSLGKLQTETDFVPYVLIKEVMPNR